MTDTGFVALRRSTSNKDVRCQIRRCKERATVLCSDRGRVCLRHSHAVREGSRFVRFEPCCRGLMVSDLPATGEFRLHNFPHPTIFGTIKTATASVGTPGEVREFDPAYLPLATYNLAERYETYMAMGEAWMQRAMEVRAKLLAGESHAVPEVERPRRQRKPRSKPAPESVEALERSAAALAAQCPWCGNRDAKHDRWQCRISFRTMMENR